MVGAIPVGKGARDHSVCRIGTGLPRALRRGDDVAVEPAFIDNL